MPKTKYYAVGLKGWVQIRRSRVPLQRLETVAFIPVREEREAYSAKRGYYDKIVTTKRKLTSVVFEGGEEVLTLSYNKFYRRMGFGVPQNSCNPLTSAQFNSLKGGKRV